MKRIMALDDRGGLGGMIYPGALINRTPCQPGPPSPPHTKPLTIFILVLFKIRNYQSATR